MPDQEGAAWSLRYSTLWRKKTGADTENRGRALADRRKAMVKDKDQIVFMLTATYLLELAVKVWDSVLVLKDAMYPLCIINDMRSFDMVERVEVDHKSTFDMK